MADVILSAFAGINNVLPSERIRSLPSRENATVELASAVNVDIDASGQVTRRAGITTLVPGAAHSVWSEGGDCFYVSGTQLRRLAVDNTTAVVATLTSTAPVAYLSLNGRIYWTNGTDTGIIVNQVNRSWGMDVPDAPTVGAISGTLLAGSYQASITHIRSNGQESGAGLPVTVTVADNGGVRFTWADPVDPDITEVALYLSEPNGMVLYKAGEYPVGQLTADITDPTLALPLDAQWLDKPPAGQALAYSNGRIYIAQDQFIFATPAHDYERCDQRDFLAIDDTPIGLFVGVRAGLFIGTEKAVYFTSGDRFEAFELRTVASSPCIPGSAVIVDAASATGNNELSGRKAVLFATERGIVMGMDDGSVVNLTEDRYRYATVGTAAVFRDTGLLQQYLFFPTIVNTRTRAVTTYAGVEPQSATFFNKRLLLATDTGIESLSGDSDRGLSIDASVASGMTDLGSQAIKHVTQVTVGYRAGGDVDVTMVIDAHHSYTYTMLPRQINEQHATRVKFGRGARGRYWSWKISNRDGADFALDSLSFDVEPMRKKVA